MSRAMLTAKNAGPAAPTGAVANASSKGLRISEPDDAFEKEADRVSDEIMAGGRPALPWSISRMSVDPPLHRQCDCGGSGECEECKAEKKLQRKPSRPTEAGEAPPIVHEVLRSPGTAIDRAECSFFEARFGVDFARVRVHTDAKAAESVRRVNALAYAVGPHIAFASGRYSPRTTEGRRLIAHELTHTIQQRPDLFQARRGAADDTTKFATGHAGSTAPGKKPLITQVDPVGRLARQGPNTGQSAGQPTPVPLPVVETEEDELKQIGNSETVSNAGRTWGWGAPETNNVYQKCNIASLEREKFKKFVKSLPPAPWHGRNKPPGADEVLGITSFNPGEAKPPEIAAVATQQDGNTVYKLKPTHAEMPPIRSAYTQAGEYPEGFQHDLTVECAAERSRLGTSKFPIHWTMTPDGAQKTMQAEQEHCDDIRVAFDLTLGLYASAINNLAASERTYRREADLIKDGTRAAGVTPEMMLYNFYEMAQKTKLRDDSGWHTAQPIGDPRNPGKPKKEGCRYLLTINATSWPEVGTHPTAEVMGMTKPAQPPKSPPASPTPGAGGSKP
jgi:hypothetical protein